MILVPTAGRLKKKKKAIAALARIIRMRTAIGIETY